MTISISTHAQKAMNKRCVSELMIDAALIFGDQIRSAGSLYYFLGKRAIKRLNTIFQTENPERWEGLVLVCDPANQTLITCFKNKKWLKQIRNKK